MNIQVRHDILVSGRDLAECERRVHHFFDTTQLVRYDEIHIDRHKSFCAADDHFTGQLEAAMSVNRKTVAKLLTELQEAGCRSLEDVANVQQGLASKLFHTIAHMLDGFFGVDSRFFDLDMASHRLSGKKIKQIEKDPQAYYLLAVTGIAGKEVEGVQNIKRKQKADHV